MDVVALIISAISAAIAGIALTVSIRRHPRVGWVMETDEITEDLEADEVGHEAQRWRVVLVNRGRETATDVRTRYTHHDGAVTPWVSHGSVAQGEEVVFSAGMRPQDLAKINEPLTPRGEGPAYEMSWRGEKDKRDPQIEFFRPPQSETTFDR